MRRIQKPYLGIAVLVLLLSSLACNADNMRARDLPVLECATPIPPATLTMPPTMTMQPSPTVLAGTATPTPAPTYTPMATYTPPPLPTPVTFLTDFSLGKSVRIGGVGGVGLGITVTIDNVEVDGPFTVGVADRYVTSWDVTIQNRSLTTNYEYYPFSQFYVLEVYDFDGTTLLRGDWAISAEAHVQVGLPVLDISETINTLEPGQTKTVKVAAFTPTDEPWRFAYVLDPLDTVNVEEMAEANSLGSNVGIWINTYDDGCGNSLYIPPTPGSPEGPTATPLEILARHPVESPFITRGFGCQPYFTGELGTSCPADAPWFHNGTDYGGVTGDVIRDVLDVSGQVQFAGIDAGGPDCSDIEGSLDPHTGYGNYIKQTADVTVDSTTYGLQIWYAHLSAFSIGSSDPTFPSQQLGDMGSTGCSTGPHLHFAVKIDNLYADPCTLIPGGC